MVKKSHWLKVYLFPIFARISTKLALGVITLSFLFNYQPEFDFPPVKQDIVKAQFEQTQTINASLSPLKFQLPHPGYLSTSYSRFHPGVDIATGLGMPINPIAEGTVTESGYNIWGLGFMAVVDHGYGYKSTYGHLGRIYTKTGQKVAANSTLGTVGLTGFTSGPHTHLEVTRNGSSIDPLTILPEIRKMPQPQSTTSPSTANIGPGVLP